MREHPILFSAPMVRAILEGRKTQTRRVLKPQPIGDVTHPLMSFNRGRMEWSLSKQDRDKNDDLIFRKFHNPGDTLWVREAWRTMSKYDSVAPRDLPTREIIGYDADYHSEPNDGYRGKGRPSIHMPRWASRITLKVTNIRVQRLHDISEADAKAEGAYQDPTTHGHWITGAPGQFNFGTAYKAFAALWTSINGEASWDANPWVVAYSFERLTP